MKVHIEKNLYIESDERQFIIKDYTGKQDKNGNALYTTKGYFTTLESACKHVVKLKVMDSTAQTLNELVSDIKAIKSDIEAKITI